MAWSFSEACLNGDFFKPLHYSSLGIGAVILFLAIIMYFKPTTFYHIELFGNNTFASHLSKMRSRCDNVGVLKTFPSFATFYILPYVLSA